MARVIRVDSSRTGSVERTPEGGLRVAANFTRVGHDVGHDDTFVNGHVRIEDASAVQAVDERRDISCGYDRELDPSPGVYAPTGQRYDAIQRKIRYNHVALLPPGKGRAGSQVSLRMDAEPRLKSNGRMTPRGTR